MNLQQLPAGVTHLWNFEESSGTTVVDVVGGHATNGTIVGGTLTRFPEKVGQALSFSGSSGGYVSIGSRVFPDHPSALTYSVWYCPDPQSPLPGNYLLATTPWSVIWAINGHPKYGELPHNITPGFGGMAGSTELASPTSRATQWTLLTVTYDSSLPAAQMATVYVNGSRVGNMPVAAINSLTRTTGLNIGASRSGERRFVGLIGEVAFWNRALTPLEVQNLYDGGASRAKPSPQAKADPARETLEKGKAVRVKASVEPTILGSPVGTQFTDHAPHEGLLVGLKMSTSKFGIGFKASAVSSLQGVYRTKDGIVRGETNGPTGTAPTEFVAEEGYAIGALEIHVEAGRVMGIRIVFMQIEDDHLNRKVTYLSPPYLSVPDGSPVIGGDGKPIIGIKGSWAKQEMRCIGLIQAISRH